MGVSVSKKHRTVRRTLSVSKRIHVKKAGSNRKKAISQTLSTKKAIAAKKSTSSRPGTRLRRNRAAASRGKVKGSKVSPNREGTYTEEYNKGFNSGYEEGFKVGHAKGSEDGLEQAYGELEPK